MTTNKNKTVYVGMSGGVDSSVSAALLKDAGYNVVGVFIRAWYPDFISCTWREDRRDAMRVCAHLKVPFKTMDLEKEYRDEVVGYMIDEYKRGRVPNPDVMCNTKIKFGHFLRRALEEGADFVATGHYAQVAEKEGSKALLESVDDEKDQTYFLWSLISEKLEHVLFPVGGYEKSHVRKLAQQYELPTATKKDSQGLCFLGAVDMKEFLTHFIDTTPGNVLDTEGNVIGEHDGAPLYTIGERRGFTITKKSPDDKPRYVVAKDLKTNTITVDEKNPREKAPQSTKHVILEDVNWIREKPSSEHVYQGRVRYREMKAELMLEEEDSVWHARFRGAQPSVARGQSLVIYDDKECIGGGVVGEYV